MTFATRADLRLRDARYAVRVLRRSPSFTAAALVTLAAAIAINTAAFSVIDAVLLKPLPYPEPDRLALVSRTVRADGRQRTDISHDGATWEMARDRLTGADAAVFSTWTTGVNLVAGGTGRGAIAKYVQQQRIGAGFFGVLGVRPAAGREFTRDEDRVGGPRVVIVAASLWRSLLHSDPAAVGKTIVLRGEPYEIVGVMPDGFQSGERADLWTPLRASTTGEGEGENFTIAVRRHVQTTTAELSAHLQRLGDELTRSRPQRPIVLSAVSMQRGLTEAVRAPLLILWTAVAIVLLVATVNLAGLFLARGAARTREMATRLALGSSRASLVRQLAMESLVLAAGGCALGMALGVVVLDALRGLAERAFDLWQPIALDGRAVSAAMALSLVSSALFGLAPALQASRLAAHPALAGTARTIATRSARWGRRVLVVTQVALAVVLLVAAGLLLRTFVHLRNVEPGFDPSGVVAATVSLEDARYRTAAAVNHLFDESLTRMRHIPGVEAAAVTLGLPYERLLNLGFARLDGASGGDGPRRGMTAAAYVTPEFFRVLRIPIRRGRVFDSRDTADSPGVVVINESFARTHFDGVDPMGRRIAFAGREREVIGIVANVQVKPPLADLGPVAALPLALVPVTQASDGMLRVVHGWFSPAFIVRANGETAGLVDAMRRAVDGIDPLLPFAAVRSLDAVRAESLVQQRLMMALLLALSAVAMLLAAVGIHGLIASAVVERTREMGIRLALGATGTQAMRTVAAPGLLLAAIGTIAGCAAAAGAVRLLRHFIWGISETDAATYAGVALVLLAVAAAASFGPALRILRLDPAVTLRAE